MLLRFLSGNSALFFAIFGLDLNNSQPNQINIMSVDKLPRIPLRRDQKLVRDVGNLSLKLRNAKMSPKYHEGGESQDLKQPMRRERTFTGGLAAAPAKVSWSFKLSSR